MCYCKEPARKGWTHDITACWLTAAFPSFKPSSTAESADRKVA